MKKYISISLVVLAIVVPFSIIIATYGVQTKTVHCVANQVLPDPKCTPGAVLTTNAKIVCVSGYTKTVRNVSESIKKRVFTEYGIPYSQRGNYEVDHLISLELGGSNAISNLWPENSTLTNGSNTKDRFENYLHKQVCNGSMTLTEAQREISTNWVQYYLATQTTKPTTTTNTQTNVIIPVVPIAPLNQNNNSTYQDYDAVPVGVTAKCRDGTYSYSANRRGTCSHHGGVEEWY